MEKKIGRKPHSRYRIVIHNREESSRKVNEILSDYGNIIVGRMGVLYKEKGISVIAIMLTAQLMK